MKVKTIQVLWHAKAESTAGAPKPAPVFSVDFDPATGRLVTGGADKEVKLWSLGEDADGNADVTHLETLTAHTKAVNVVRFSPGGDILASGGDTGEVLLWRRAPDGTKNLHGDLTSWKTANTLRGHSDDVQDLAWAPGGAALVTGSVDNSSIVWSESTARGLIRLEGHEHYVQGVAWDPQGEFVASASGDRKVNVYATTPRSKVPVDPTQLGGWCKKLVCQKEIRRAVGTKGLLFQDDTLESFFRRLAWSPCGSFLAIPAGVHREPHKGEEHATYLYQRGRFARPAMRLPCVAPAVCVRFSPALYQKPGVDAPATPAPERADDASVKETEVKVNEEVKAEGAEGADTAVREGAEGDVAIPADGGAKPASDAEAAVSAEPAPTVDLPYRVVFAVCTTDTVAVYDTTKETPVAFVSGLHYATITDAAWSPCGMKLVVSSSDGYCSALTFTESELGKVLAPEEVPEHIAHVLPSRRVLSSEKRARVAAEAAKAAAKGGKRAGGKDAKQQREVGPNRRDKKSGKGGGKGGAKQPAPGNKPAPKPPAPNGRTQAKQQDGKEKKQPPEPKRQPPPEPKQVKVKAPKPQPKQRRGEAEGGGGSGHKPVPAPKGAKADGGGGNRGGGGRGGRGGGKPKPRPDVQVFRSNS